MTYGHDAIAISGMAGQYPGDRDMTGLWTMLLDGVSAVRRFRRRELTAAEVPAAVTADPSFVPFSAAIPGVDGFDAAFFGIPPSEAQLIDPQRQTFLEGAYSALEKAGTVPADCDGRFGAFASTHSSSYPLRNILSSPQEENDSFPMQYPAHIGNDKNFPRPAYRSGWIWASPE
ncbi:beta-ketoacyl synthase N-terminal-like domain-containing protein [Streptomyces sp. NPDC051909]|uniref:beta-ketoacyl synthase N-terminal-like domain-containing protein n=1 Tax=Streptomyces sp. NPDC051909 TaxID=3154944 RepID=UPI00341BC934